MSSATTAKERPILFSGPMVRAIMDGRKTQTRRVVKPQPTHRLIEGMGHVTVGMRPELDGQVWYDGDCIGPGREVRCPYGRVGDRLFVREAWRADMEWDDSPPRDIQPMAWDGTRKDIEYEATREGDPERFGWGRLRPGIHMPRWAVRLTLEVTGVRAERVVNLTDEDAVAEGFADREAFWRTFYDLNHRAPRDSNPWVWVVEFTPRV